MQTVSFAWSVNANFLEKNKKNIIKLSSADFAPYSGIKG